MNAVTAANWIGALTVVNVSLAAVASAAAAELGVPVHTGEYPEETRVRIGKYRPDEAHYEKNAYPEQGEVGPVIPYPENRPRRIPDEGRRQKPEGASSSAEG